VSAAVAVAERVMEIVFAVLSMVMPDTSVSAISTVPPILSLMVNRARYPERFFAVL